MRWHWHAAAGEDAPEELLARLDEVRARDGEAVPGSGVEQGANEMRLARSPDR